MLTVNWVWHLVLETESQMSIVTAIRSSLLVTEAVENTSFPFPGKTTLLTLVIYCFTCLSLPPPASLVLVSLTH